MESLTELLEEQLKDLYSAENQLLKALPKMAKKASTQELKDAFLMHTEETRVHAERLQQVAQILGTKPTGKVCAAMKGLIEEGQEVLEEDGKNAVIDGALIAAAQRVEHYEMAAYGTVRVLAELLGQNEVAQLFETTLDEEKVTDEKLTMIAEENVYPNAPKTEGEEGEEEEEGGQSGGRSGGGRSGGGRSGGGRSGRSSGGKKSGGSSGRSSGGNRRPPSRAAASKGGKNSRGKSKSR